MADDETIVTWECPKHPGLNSVVGTRSDGDYVHVQFGCGCTVEFEIDSVKDLPGLEVGDAVLWNGELFRLDDIVEDEEGIWGVIINTGGEEEVLIDALDYVAKDTLTGVGMKNVIKAPSPMQTTRYSDYISRGSSSYSGYNSWSSKSDKYIPPGPKPKPKPVKRDSISTSSLIEDEVKSLKDGGASKKPQYDSSTYSSSQPKGTTRPLRTKTAPTPKKAEEADNNEVKPNIPRRKGDW